MKQYRFVVQDAQGIVKVFMAEGASQKDARATLTLEEGQSVIAWAEIKERKPREQSKCMARFAWVEIGADGEPVLIENTYAVVGTSGRGKNAEMLVRRALHNAGTDVSPTAVLVSVSEG